MKWNELKENFQYLETWESRYEYLIDLGNQLPKFEDSQKNTTNRIKGCLSKVWILHEKRNNLNYFNVDSDSKLVKGLGAVIISIFNEKTTENINNINYLDEVEGIDLIPNISMNRSHGILSMVNKIKVIVDKI